MRYTHDCPNCKPLGEHGSADLYFCPQGGIPTVIARYSDEGGDYASGLGFTLPDLVEAERRAKEQGYIP